MRLIDADRFKNWLLERYVIFDHTLDDIDAQPTIDAVSVKHGRWVYYEDETIEDGGRCSLCQCDQPVVWEDWTWKYAETDYCPNCGARMDGD